MAAFTITRQSEYCVRLLNTVMSNIEYGQKLIPFVERWLNTTIGRLTGYTPLEIMLREPRTDIFEDNFSKSSDQTPPEE
jgi:hypothetical protein